MRPRGRQEEAPPPSPPGAATKSKKECEFLGVRNANRSKANKNMKYKVFASSLEGPRLATPAIANRRHSTIK
jgi:hypothetical protein